VVGAGAAGLIAAMRAAECGRQTLLLEKNRRPGVKILMSGGTRCNITQNTDNQGIIAAYGPAGRFLHSALAALSVDDTLALFAAEGLETKVEPTGKIFPASDRATDVLAALLRRLDRSGATVALEEPLRELHVLENGRNGFRLVTARRELHAGKLILTTGGQSFPGSGTTGDGYRWAAALGHTIVPPRPALVPITVGVPWVREMSGVTLPDVAVRVLQPNGPGADAPNATASSARKSSHGERGAQGEVLAQRRGSFLFTHFGLSGPVVLDVSRAVSGHERPQSLVLECDFLPAMPAGELEAWLRTQCASAGKRLAPSILPESLPRRLIDRLLATADIAQDRRAAELTRDERSRLVEACKRLRIPVTGTLGFRKAEVTAGGVSLGEVDSRTMQSKLVPGLYLAGEVLDLDGPIGGYNFQAAWSTGWLAGGAV
jgi:predicted flavoprotein YhiN